MAARSSRSASGVRYPAATKPKAPASATAAVSAGVDAPPASGACTIGTRSAPGSIERDTGEVFSQCLPEDLVNYGLIPEFIGRLPVMSAIHQLSKDDLVTILTEPRNALVKQFQRFFSFDGIELVFSDDSLSSIAQKALERETGARGLRSIIEETLLDVQFELPSRRDVKKCVVTKETVERGVKPTLVTEAAPEDRAAKSA